MTRVLFVDDEPRVLEGLERMLFDVDTDWETSFVTSGHEALALLDRERFDVVVSDMRMPKMDGATLLSEVHARHPELLRIVLSGQTDEEGAIRVAAVAHQFLGKPCPAHHLLEVIEGCLRMQAVLRDPALRAMVGHVGKLPAAPSVYAELGRLVDDPTIAVDEIARVIGRDPVLTARVLHLVSSAFFSQGPKVTNIREATLRLGCRTIRNLTLSAEIFESVAAESIGGVDVEALRKRAEQRATLAAMTCADDARRHDATTAALLCDLGTLVLAKSGVPQFVAAAVDSVETGRHQHEVEAERFPATHAEVGAYLLGVWGLPHAVVEAVANHHRPDRVPRIAADSAPRAVCAAEALLGGTRLPAGWVADLGLGGFWTDLEAAAARMKEEDGHG